jgi:hypothetical protein
MQLKRVQRAQFLEALKSANRISIEQTPVVSNFLPGISQGILKFDVCSVAELFGYQLAAILGMRTPRIEGYWIPESLGQPYPAPPGRIGALVEYFPDWRRLTWTEAAELDPDFTARALALCAFDRFEWGEFGQAQSTVYFVDLERLLAPIVPDLWAEVPKKEIRRKIERHIQGFLRTQSLDLPGVLERAQELNMLDSVKRQLRSLNPDSANSLIVEGHPWSRTLVSAYRRCAKLAMENLREHPLIV